MLLKKRSAISERIRQYRYGFLFTAMIGYLLLLPLVQGQYNMAVPVVYFIMLYTVLNTLDLPRRVFRTVIGLGLFMLVMHGIWLFTGTHRTDSLVDEILVSSSYFLFSTFSLIVLMRRIFSEKKVTADTIKGGIAVYFLAGLAWAFLYMTLMISDSGAFSLVMGDDLFSKLVYFSFVTMTTLGYGDITPQTSLAQTLAFLQAALGPIYLAVLIARLVGRHGK